MLVINQFFAVYTRPASAAATASTTATGRSRALKVRAPAANRCNTGHLAAGLRARVAAFQDGFCRAAHLRTACARAPAPASPVERKRAFGAHVAFFVAHCVKVRRKVISAKLVAAFARRDADQSAAKPRRASKHAMRNLNDSHPPVPVPATRPTGLSPCRYRQAQDAQNMASAWCRQPGANTAHDPWCRLARTPAIASHTSSA